MNLEDQVAPLDLAREMKAIGFPQDTLHRWTVEGHVQSETEPWTDNEGKTHGAAACAAPTVAEMGEWLPAGFDSGSYEDPFTDVVSWEASPGREYGDPKEPRIWKAATEAEARARLLLALAAAGTIKPAELAVRS